MAAVRLAGPHSLKILDRFFKPQANSQTQPFLLRYGLFVSSEGETLDEVMAVYMPHGKSYTGLEQVEVFCHGGRKIVQMIMEELLTAGARAAQPGEFTKLAFLNGRIDLAKAEAVAEIIAANTDSSVRASREHLLGAYGEHIEQIREQLVTVLADLEASIDFSEEEIDPGTNVQAAKLLMGVENEIAVLVDSYTGGRIINEGFKIAIGGRPNAGKSSLFNLLLRQERALVNPEAGTTRDYLSEWIDLEGFAVNLVDTAGLRAGGSKIEKEGQARAEKILREANLLLWMVDLSDENWRGSLEVDAEKFENCAILLVGNKIDLVGDTTKTAEPNTMSISCLTRKGLKGLRR
ncbi:MAG: tRNA uridine-5-carboxymethylaminomethyl(34) synthesis GTPase MnmE, partial [bacterium]|nr:tRNA uridine-5-carboxymethylaminomethyl(34) synthesis GTPase MnmE [bacterium]